MAVVATEEAAEDDGWVGGGTRETESFCLRVMLGQFKPPSYLSIHHPHIITEKKKAKERGSAEPWSGSNSTMANSEYGRESKKEQVIAIVGAGISGLLACKYCLSKGFDPIVFESESSIGGVWTKTIGSTTLQTPKPLYQFSDYPWPDTVTELFPDQQTVLEYIESYANHFDLVRHIQFNNKVLSLSYQDNGEYSSISGERNLWGEAFSSKGKWNVTVEDTRSLSTQ
ncbi:hypothetical protein FXO37_36832, partial [Capsicum annuum]